MHFSLTYLRVEALRQLRNPFTLAFTLAMPVGMYVLFGASTPYADASVGNGNVAFYVMCSMAAYGAAYEMTSMSAFAATESARGWGRQLALTPLTTAGYALMKVVVGLCFATVATLVVFVVGATTGAEADAVWRWAAVAGIVLAGGALFGLFGLGLGLAFESDAGARLAAIAITFFGFFGNVFMPLDGVMLDIARFTPMYGYVALVRWPVTEGVLTNGAQDPLWAALLNVGVWTLLFALLARYGVRQSTRRQ